MRVYAHRPGRILRRAPVARDRPRIVVNSVMLTFSHGGVVGVARSDGVIGDSVRPPVALDADAVDRRALLNQPAQQDHRAFVLGAGLDAVVVVIEPGLGVGLVGKLECQRQELRANRLQPLRIAQVFKARVGAVADGLDGVAHPWVCPYTSRRRVDVVSEVAP